MLTYISILLLLSQDVPVYHVADEDAIAIQWAKIELDAAQRKYDAAVRRSRDKHNLSVPVTRGQVRQCGDWKHTEDFTSIVFVPNAKTVSGNERCDESYAVE